jgi:hypothetical protein
MRIRRGLASRRLPCGCAAGIYETYGDEVVTIIDARHHACADPAHVDGNVVPTPPISDSPPDHETPDG